MQSSGYLIIIGCVIGCLFFLCLLIITKLKKSPIVVQNTLKVEKFLEEVDKTKQDYFTESVKKKFIQEYRDVYEFFNRKPYLFIRKSSVSQFKRIYTCLDSLVKQWNIQFVNNELERNKDIFDNIDGKSLDSQQRKAVVVDEDNNLVLASAGSGKTLTISAKVKYLVDRKKVLPEEILLITFTRKAAEEMYQRISQKLNIGVEVKTFHKLGLDIITKSRKDRPDVVEELINIIDSYFNENVYNDKNQIQALATFFGYYINIPKDLEEFNNLGECVDYYRTVDFETIKGKFEIQQKLKDKTNRLKDNKETLQGERVKSLEELMIANFLFLNGVRYIYEYRYPFESDDKFRKKYRPDFYLPDYDIYIEHFGITEDNRVPWLSEVEEKKYLDGIQWKRETHKKNRTTLLETYSYYNKEGILLIELEKKLRELKVEFKDPDFKKIYKEVFMNNNENSHFKEFEKLISTFIGLFKSNNYSVEYFEKLKVDANKIENTFLKQRNKLFLDIVKPIFIKYQKYLEDNDMIDFNDMINEATKIVKEGNAGFNYKYIIIDEYQDISMSRFNLIKEIKIKTNAKVMCVGDDWQSIYRFAGSDINLFSNFEKYLGYYELLKIENTYRNSQELINIASSFIMKNENQLKKEPKSTKHHSNPIRIISYDSNDSEASYNNPIIQALEKVIEEIVDSFGDEAQITILGRNNFDIDVILSDDHNLSSAKLEKQAGLEDEIATSINDFDEPLESYLSKLNLPVDGLPYQINKRKKTNNTEQKFKLIKIKNQVQIKYRKYPKLNINFLTVHRSKGLEADNIIVINLENTLLGFPNKISDDPVLSLVLTDLDAFPFAEERRLFYVALTRTRNTTYLITPKYNQSIFCEELVHEFKINQEAVNNTQVIRESPLCPKCQKGHLVIRKNNLDNKKFLGCSNFPFCDAIFNELEIIDDHIKCDKCGGYMVKRTGIHGQFYGCTNYPYCNHTLNIADK
jgi:DNA helicase IV